MTLSLRVATFEDCSMLFDLRNGADVRAVSMSQEPINEKTHCAWLRKSLNDPARVIYIIESAGQAMGMVRLDETQTSIEISIALTQNARGQGIGRIALAMAMEQCAFTKPIFSARIRPDNSASLALFRQSGFIQTTDPFIHHRPRI